MKANEAPEKIYLINDDLNIKREWYKTKQVGFDTTEYTLTDAFIEKAKKWFEKQNEWFDPNGNRHCDLNGFEDFRKYIEGEKV